MIRQFVLLFAFAVSPARADAPQAPAADHVVRSPNGRCAARAEVAAEGAKIVGFSASHSLAAGATQVMLQVAARRVNINGVVMN